MSQEPNGQELIRGKSGQAYPSENAARHAMSMRSMSEDEYEPVPEPEGTGWAIARKGEPQEVKKSPGPPPEEYWRVKFQERSNPNDTELVELTVNCETLQIQRNVEVTIPQRYREAADHATYPKFVQLPDQIRKTVGAIQIYPYTTIGPGKAEDFFRARSTGTKKILDRIASEGLPGELR